MSSATTSVPIRRAMRTTTTRATTTSDGWTSYVRLTRKEPLPMATWRSLVRTWFMVVLDTIHDLCFTLLLLLCATSLARSLARNEPTSLAHSLNRRPRSSQLGHRTARGQKVLSECVGGLSGCRDLGRGRGHTGVDRAGHRAHHAQGARRAGRHTRHDL